jgi:type III secretory pathway component EscV
MENSLLSASDRDVQGLCLQDEVHLSICYSLFVFTFLINIALRYSWSELVLCHVKGSRILKTYHNYIVYITIYPVCRFTNLNS